MIPVLILAGGKATRLGALTKDTPKSLIEVAGRPFAEHQIELLKRNGYTDIVFLVGHLGEMFYDVFGYGSRLGVRIRYVHDEGDVGTGGAVSLIDWNTGPWFVLYGDTYLDCDYAVIERMFFASDQIALMTVYRNEDRWDRSNVLLQHHRIVGYDKTFPPPGSQHIDAGLSALHTTAFNRYERLPLDLSTVFQRALISRRLATYEVPNRFYEIGSPEGLAETRAYLEGKG